MTTTQRYTLQVTNRSKDCGSRTIVVSARNVVKGWKVTVNGKTSSTRINLVDGQSKAMPVTIKSGRSKLFRGHYFTFEGFALDLASQKSTAVARYILLRNRL